MIRARKTIAIYMIEYELFGLRKFWHESLSKDEAKRVRDSIRASGAVVKVHVLQMNNPQAFIEPLPTMRKTFRNPKKRRRHKE
jgi:hypothetical protein